MAKGYSKQVTDRQKLTRALVHTIDTNADAIGAGLESVLAPVGAGEKDSPAAKGPYLAAFVRLLGKHLAASGTALEHADKAHELEMADDVAPRNTRDEFATKARETLIELRALLEPTYGESSLVALGIADAVPQDPQAILSVGKRVQAALATASLGEPRRKGVTLDLKVFAKELTSTLKPLEQALNDVAREAREGQVTLAAKTQARQIHEDDFQRVATLVEGLARFAGLQDVAARVRPSARKPSQTDMTPAEAAPTEDASG